MRRRAAALLQAQRPEATVAQSREAVATLAAMTLARVLPTLNLTGLAQSGRAPSYSPINLNAYDEEGNTQVDAADPRIDYLSGTDGPRGYELHGALLEVKSEK